LPVAKRLEHGLRPDSRTDGGIRHLDSSLCWRTAVCQARREAGFPFRIDAANTQRVSELVARQDELRAVADFLNRVLDGPATLVLEGAAGIGKSTLWTAGVETARERCISVLACRADEAEQGLAYTGLADLLEPELGRILPALSPPRR